MTKINCQIKSSQQIDKELRRGEQTVRKERQIQKI